MAHVPFDCQGWERDAISMRRSRWMRTARAPNSDS